MRNSQMKIWRGNENWKEISINEYGGLWGRVTFRNVKLPQTFYFRSWLRAECIDDARRWKIWMTSSRSSQTRFIGHDEHRLRLNKSREMFLLLRSKPVFPREKLRALDSINKFLCRDEENASLHKNRNLCNKSGKNLFILVYDSFGTQSTGSLIIW